MKITHVAILDGEVTYSMPEPGRHHDLIRQVSELKGAGFSGLETQGFLTEEGQFLTRRAAYALAFSTGQIKRKPHGYRGNELFSEDLW